MGRTVAAHELVVFHLRGKNAGDRRAQRNRQPLRVLKTVASRRCEPADSNIIQSGTSANSMDERRHGKAQGELASAKMS